MATRHHARRIQVALGAIRIRLPIVGLSPQTVLVARDVTREVLNSAHAQFFERRTLFGQPLKVSTLVTRVRSGSIEFDVLYQIVVNLPYAEAGQLIQSTVKTGLHYLKEIGAVAGGIYALKGTADLLKSKLRSAEASVENTEEVEVTAEPCLEIDDNPQALPEHVDALRACLHHEKDVPSTYGTIILELKVLHEILSNHRLERDGEQNVGGNIVIRDLNLYRNGFHSLEEIEKGDLFFLHNYAALGLSRINEKQALVISAEQEDPDIKIVSVELNTFHVPAEDAVLRGRPIDSDTLDDA